MNVFRVFGETKIDMSFPYDISLGIGGAVNVVGPYRSLEFLKGELG